MNPKFNYQYHNSNCQGLELERKSYNFLAVSIKMRSFVSVNQIDTEI
jgi:hypothetical protein